MEAVKGWSQTNKDHLPPAVAKALDIDTHKHVHVEGIDKASLKARLHALKKARAEAMAAGDMRKVTNEQAGMRIWLRRMSIGSSGSVSVRPGPLTTPAFVMIAVATPRCPFFSPLVKEESAIVAVAVRPRTKTVWKTSILPWPRRETA